MTHKGLISIIIAGGWLVQSAAALHAQQFDYGTHSNYYIDQGYSNNQGVNQPGYERDHSFCPMPMDSRYDNNANAATPYGNAGYPSCYYPSYPYPANNTGYAECPEYNCEPNYYCHPAYMDEGGYENQPYYSNDPNYFGNYGYGQDSIYPPVPYYEQDPTYAPMQGYGQYPAYAPMQGYGEPGIAADCCPSSANALNSPNADPTWIGSPYNPEYQFYPNPALSIPLCQPLPSSDSTCPPVTCFPCQETCWGSSPALCCDQSPCSQSCCNRGFLMAGVEGLYWTVFQTNLDYAVDFNFDPSSEQILGPGKRHFLNYDWKAGGRGYLGVNSCCWEVKAVYTWFEDEACGKTRRNGEENALKATLLHPATGLGNANSASGDNHLNYQTIDLLFGKNIFLCCNSVLLYPFFGARGLKLKQDLTARYFGEDIGEDPRRVKWNSDLKSVGLHAGMDYYYCCFGNFGLFGSFAGSILAGRTDNHHRQHTLNDEGNIEETAINLREREFIPFAGYHLSAGLYVAACKNDCFLFRLKLGYEFNEWIKAPQLRRYYDDGNTGMASSATTGNIALHGAILSAEISF